MTKQVRITSTLSLISILSLSVSIDGNSIKILEPTCRGSDDEGARSIDCGSSIQTNVEGGTKILGDLCSDEKRLQISILREHIDVERNLYFSKNCFISLAAKSITENRICNILIIHFQFPI